MKTSCRVVLSALVAALCLAAVPSQGAVVKPAVDWEQFLARHDLVWDSLPKVWDDAAFIGNGLVGATIYSDGTNALQWDVGRSDVVDRGGRVAIGRFVLVPEGKTTNATMRLDLWNAQAQGKLQTDQTEIDWRSITHADKLVSVIELTERPGAAPAKLVFKHLSPAPARPAARSPSAPQNGATNTNSAVDGGTGGTTTGGTNISGADQPSPAPTNPTAEGSSTPQDEANPNSSYGETGGVQWCLQKFRSGGGYVVAWGERPRSRGQRVFYFTVDFVPNGAPSNTLTTVKAVADIRSALEASPDKLVRTHRDWWHAFYPQSFLSIPDTRMESFYWLQMYKLASGTRADRPALDLMGPWFRTTPWPRIWWNLNIQLTYWPVYAANRLDLGESLTRIIDAHITNLINNVPAEWRSDSAGIGRSSSYDCVRSVADASATRGVLERGDLTWVLHNYWLQYRYSGDEKMLRERLYPILKRAAGYYLHLLSTGEDGKLHLALSLSPEYPNPNGSGNALVHDANFDLSLLRWALQTLLATNDRFHLNDPLAAKWRETLNKLTRFPVNENGYMVGADTPFAVSHRHYSHLFMIYPLHLVDSESAADRPLIETSLDHWQSMPAALRGYSFSGGSAMSSWLGRNNDAARLLNVLLDPVDDKARNKNQHVRWNTMYTEAGPVIETPLSGAASVHEMLLQSWSMQPFGTHIRIFPAVPDNWKEASFDKLLAEGAFEVSAARHDGKTKFVQIKSLAGAPCRVATGLEEPIVASGSRLLSRFHLRTETDPNGKRITTVDLRKGETVLLTSGAQKLARADRSIRPVLAQPARMNYYGSPKPAETITPKNESAPPARNQ